MRKKHSLPVSNKLFIFLNIIFAWPFGMVLMWKYTAWNIFTKLLITGITGVIILLLLTPGTYLWSGITKSSVEKKINPPDQQSIKFAPEYEFQTLNNKLTKVQNSKYNFSFEIPNDYHQIGYADSKFETREVFWGKDDIGLQSPKREINNSVSKPIIVLSPIEDRDKLIWTSGAMYDDNEYYGKEEAVTAIKDSYFSPKQVFLEHRDNITYKLTYDPDYEVKNGEFLTEEDLKKEAEVFKHIIETFTIQ